jgi:hypothetical protein
MPPQTFQSDNNNKKSDDCAVEEERNEPDSVYLILT